MEKTEKLVLIDGNSLINRAFYALPILSNSDGEFSNAVYGFCNILIKLIETEAPKYMAVAFDMGYPTFRHQMYGDYKAGRKKMPDELASQLPLLKATLASMNIKFVEQKGIEADDLVGTLSKKFGVQTIVVSGDRDLFQLVDEKTTVFFTKKGISQTIVVTPQNIKEVYGVNANQVVDLKALMGDSSDNIKGVEGIGEKTAKTLLDTYSTLDGVFQNIEKISGKLKQKLIDGKESAYLSQKLATIDCNVPIDLTLDDLQFDFPFKQSTYDIFARYEFNSLLKKTELFDLQQKIEPKQKANQNFVDTLPKLESLIENLKTTTFFAIYVDDKKMYIANSKYEQNIIEFQPDSTGEKLTKQIVFDKFGEVLKNQSIQKVVLNGKNLMHFLADFGKKIDGICFDANLAMYLLSGSKKTNYSAEDFAEKMGYDKTEIATALFASRQDLLQALTNDKMTKLYFDVELPLVGVLFQMEQNGFKLDKKILQELTTQYATELDNLTRQIYLDAGEEFNINSPKQVYHIIFEKLGFKKPKGKASTNADVLERLSGIHPIIDEILRYRKIEKLVNTYLVPFENMLDEKTGLIHTIFNQTLTATGRLSSSEPNLQNIPVRDEEGKFLRKAFISRFDGGMIVSSDYSQIELRLLAHYSGDPRLQYAYHHGIDIHSQTASDLFGVDISAVTPEMRRVAKTVNFGIIYGISEYGLSQQLGISRYEAKNFIDKYFVTYPSVKQYMQKSVETAREQGYVTTMLGRVRKIDELKSPNYMTRQFGERAAMNMPLQGTASDIIKIAMVNVSKELKRQNLKSKLILQIHDELLIDCASDEKEKVIKILREQMEDSTKLSVPLTVQISSGTNWFEAK